MIFSQHIMMESLSPEEDKNIKKNIIKDVTYRFRLNKLIRDIRNLFEHE